MIGLWSSFRKNSISVAPMMDYTDRHFRYLLRSIAPDVKLYTEMITAKALIHGDSKRLLSFHPAEKYLVLQLGGSDPKELAYGAILGEQYGYDEINLNVGCPSPRVHSGRFGACLMLEPNLVAECIANMQQKVTIPVSVKCRTGVDNEDSYESLYRFIKLIGEAGCNNFTIHARKAWLSGLSPKENREIPPLNYNLVYRIKNDFPHYQIIINGGIKTLTDIDHHLNYVDGVMLGRAICANPYLLAEIHSKYFSSSRVLTRLEVLENFLPYIEQQMDNKIRMYSMIRHILNLFQGQHGASHWRRYLSQNAHQTQAGVEILKNAITMMISQYGIAS